VRYGRGLRGKSLEETAWNQQLELFKVLFATDLPPVPVANAPLGHLLVFCAKTMESLAVQDQLNNVYHVKAATTKLHTKYGLAYWEWEPNKKSKEHLATQLKITLVTMATQQGPILSSLYVMMALQSFSPKYLITVGICGGAASVAKKTTFFGYKAYYYDTVRRTGEIELTADWSTECDGVVRTRMDEFVKQQDRKDIVITSAMSSAILDELPGLNLLTEEGKHNFDRKVLMYDMESFSVLKASSLTGVQCLGFVKNLTDNAVGEGDNQGIRKANMEKSTEQAAKDMWVYLHFYFK